jgi:endonuclease YncB( thermonuclease family)
MLIASKFKEHGLSISSIRDLGWTGIASELQKEITDYTPPVDSHFILRANKFPVKQPTADKSFIISCYNPYIIDGDTLACDYRRHIRLANINAPEIPGHCEPGRLCPAGDPFAAKDYLQSLATGSVVCVSVAIDRYGRIVARCEAGGRDLSCAMIEAGHAVEFGDEKACRSEPGQIPR